MSWKLCTSGAAVYKAGEHVNSTVSGSGTILAKWSDEAEGNICFETNTNWIDNYSALSTEAKAILSDVCSSKIAKRIIAYDTTGYLSRESDMLMNMNDDIENKGLQILKGKADKLKTP